jgi:2,5-diamino-6-(ribosylamino)-4(3H)-pyrimidinone 5'-phosphate reductase
MPSPRKRSATKLPFVFLNLAMSADGKITTANRKVASFSSPRDLEHMNELRATADAVMCGARTADLNAISLGPGGEKYQRLRKKSGLAEFNLRIIVSGSGTIDPTAAIFKKRFSPIIILTTQKGARKNLKVLQSVADEVKICGQEKINFRAAFTWLRKKWNIKRLLCEGGGELNAALFQARLVDEIHLTIVPKIIGGRQAPTIADGTGFPTLAHAAQFKLKSATPQGNELFTIFQKAS